MGKAKTNKLYRTFTKGLITEAGHLTYPEDASTDELNTILSRKGNRSRRLGLDYQPGYELENLEITDDIAVNEFVWSSINNDPTVTFACVQVGSKVYFYDMNNDPLSTQLRSNVIDLSAYKIPTASSADFPKEYASFSGGLGFLFIAHRYMDPISVEFKPNSGNLEVIPIVIQIRDFEGVYDGLANDEEPRVLSPQHHYNLKNQGWVAPGTRSVDISTPSYPAVPGSEDTPLPGSVYYDPYTGQERMYDKSGPTGYRTIEEIN